MYVQGIGWQHQTIEQQPHKSMQAANCKYFSPSGKAQDEACVI